MTGIAIQLGPWYGRNITEARRILRDRRGGGLFTAYVTAPITAPLLEVAMDSRSLYITGFRVHGTKAWWTCAPADGLTIPEPIQPGWHFPHSYTDLGLVAGATVICAPWTLLCEFAKYNGLLLDDQRKRHLLLLMFLLAEALRFDSVKAACYAYVSNAATYFGAPDHYYRNPADLDGHRFTFTQGLIDRVRGWRVGTQAGDFDLGLPWVS